MKTYLRERTGIVVGVAAVVVVLGATTAMAVPASVQRGLDSFSTSSSFGEGQPAVLQPDTGEAFAANEFPPPSLETNEPPPAADRAAETRETEAPTEPRGERAERGNPPETAPEPPPIQAEPIQASQELAPPPAPEPFIAPTPPPEPFVAPAPEAFVATPPPPPTHTTPPAAGGFAPAPPPPSGTFVAPPTPPSKAGAPATKGFGPKGGKGK